MTPFSLPPPWGHWYPRAWSRLLKSTHLSVAFTVVPASRSFNDRLTVVLGQLIQPDSASAERFRAPEFKSTISSATARCALYHTRLPWDTLNTLDVDVEELLPWLFHSLTRR